MGYNKKSNRKLRQLEDEALMIGLTLQQCYNLNTSNLWTPEEDQFLCVEPIISFTMEDLESTVLECGFDWNKILNKG